MPKSNLRLIIDENVPRKVITVLRNKGFNVLLPARKTSDPDIAGLAQKERRIIITQDKDFANPLSFPPENFHGIIRLRIHPPILSEILNALENLFAVFSDEDIDKKLIILEKDGYHIL